jgi:hypothetical protein
MPDWISHLGAAYIGARLTKVCQIQIVLIGAILPDVVMPVFVAVDLWRLPLSHDSSRTSWASTICSLCLYWPRASLQSMRTLFAAFCSCWPEP